MSRSRPRAGVLALLAGGCLVISGAGTAGGGRAPATPEAPAAAPVVVELFTSQGCSSCPPADRLLSRLGRERPGSVIPLAFHVDYWNYIGWRDPFSSRRWSRRQEGYARAFDSGRVYTPQAVVQGGADCVGSQAACIDGAIAAARGQPDRRELHLEISAAGRDGLLVEVAAAPGAAVGERLDLLVALTESGLVTPVGRGENARHTLRNDHVVRRLEELQVPPSRHAVSFPLDPGWDRRRLAVAAFVQELRQGRILGAAAVSEGEVAAVLAAASPGAAPH